MSRLDSPDFLSSALSSSGRSDPSATRRAPPNAQSRSSSSRTVSPFVPTRSGSSNHTRPIAEKWRPSAAGVAFVNEVSCGGRALAIRRSQDVEAGKYSLGTRPIPKKKNRNSVPVSRTPWHSRDSGALRAASGQSLPAAPAAAISLGNRAESSPVPFRHLADVGNALPSMVHRIGNAPSEATLRMSAERPGSRFLWMLGSSLPRQEDAAKPSSLSSDGSGDSSGVIVIDPLHLRRGRCEPLQADSVPTEEAEAPMRPAAAPMRPGSSAAISTTSASAVVAPTGSDPPDVVRTKRAAGSSVAIDTVACPCCGGPHGLDSSGCHLRLRVFD